MIWPRHLSTVTPTKSLFQPLHGSAAIFEQFTLSNVVFDDVPKKQGTSISSITSINNAISTTRNIYPQALNDLYVSKPPLTPGKQYIDLPSRSLPRFCGVSFLQGPSKAFRAAATAMSTSFSVASWTEVMTSSVVGLMTSKVFPSTPLTHSLLMKLTGGIC